MENLDLFANLTSFIHIYDGLDTAHTGGLLSITS